jgi:hypothetical protein
MRRIVPFALLLMGLIRLSADITPLIQLSNDDSAKAQAVHENLAQAEDAYRKMERQMYGGYVKSSNTKGFPAPLYSSDFRFLVGSGDPAPLLPLNSEDTTQLLAAYNAWVKAQGDLEAFHHHLLETYIAVHGSEKPAVSFGDPPVMAPAERAAFQHFRYTEDYHYILPK